AMTIAEQLHLEGREEGLARGLEEGREEGLARGREEGREEGLARGLEQGRIAALRVLLVARFGPPALDATCEARLQAATAAAIDRYLQRVVVAGSLAAVFEDGPVEPHGHW